MTAKKKAARLLFVGVFLCLVASAVVKEVMLLAVIGGVLMLLGALKLQEISLWVRPVAMLSVAQILWRVLLTVCSYFPELVAGLVLQIGGIVFAVVGLLQLVFLHNAMLDAKKNGRWAIVCHQLPILEVGYGILVVLGFFSGPVLLIARIVIGIAMAWYLYRVYQSAE